jgi:hypothetical protein
MIVVKVFVMAVDATEGSPLSVVAEAEVFVVMFVTTRGDLKSIEKLEELVTLNSPVDAEYR